MDHNSQQQNTFEFLDTAGFLGPSRRDSYGGE